MPRKLTAFDSIKFIGLHLFYRYIHAIILAPDAFAFSNKNDSKNLTPQEIQRTTLAGLSRLLCLVVENKGIFSNSGLHDQTLALNDLIKTWHVRFKAYLLNVIGDQECHYPPAGNLRRLAETWISRLPSLKQVADDSKEISLNVEVFSIYLKYMPNDNEKRARYKYIKKCAHFSYFGKVIHFLCFPLK